MLLGQVGHQTRQELIITSNRAQASPGATLAETGGLEGRGIVTVRRFQPFRFDGVLQLAAVPQRRLVARLAHSFSFEKLFEDAHAKLLVRSARAELR